MPADVDLHIHSNKSSDGEFSPCEIVRLAQNIGLKAISITDHDTVDAYPDALRHGRKAKIEIIPGIELTTQFDGREFHLLLPFIEWQNYFVKELVAEAAKRRFLEARARVKKLQEIGMDVQWEDVKKEAGKEKRRSYIPEILRPKAGTVNSPEVL